MRYLGGKSRIAKQIAAVVAPRGLWWEPFCGGLSVSVQLAKYGPGIVSDANAALIALYQAVRDGWTPPQVITKREWDNARTLPDSDPRKAFAGFACSFGGKWFAGYDGEKRSPVRNDSITGPRLTTLDPAGSGSRLLVKQIAALAGSRFLTRSFFDVEPGSLPIECIYADPPYAGTTGYGAVGAFGHDRFWKTCQAWADAGTRVFVSEYDAHAQAETVWSKQHRSDLRRVFGAGDSMTTERLFRILPLAEREAA